MKKTTRTVCILLMGAIFLTCLASCFGPKIPKYNYSAQGFGSLRSTSVEEFYMGLENFPAEKLEKIREWERDNMSTLRQETHVSEDEEREGIFDYVRNKLLEEKTLIMPFYRGEQAPLYIYESIGSTAIYLDPSALSRKPEITYGVNIEGLHLTIKTCFYDKSLVKEANEKGASWLKSQLQSDGLNVYNYERFVKEDKETTLPEYRYDWTVYEKEYRLGDRDVKAMVVDDSLRKGAPPLITIYFVYDDMLINVRCNPETVDIEKILTEITFRKVYLPTNTPVEGE